MNKNHTILIVDDEKDIRALVGGILEDEGYEIAYADTHQSCFDVMASKSVDMVLLDIWLENSAKDGIGILEDITAEYANLPVIMMSGHGNIETAVKALHLGAYDFIEKPFKTERLLMLVSRALEMRSLKKENIALKNKTDDKEKRDIVGSSQAAQSLKQMIERVAPTNSRVLLKGEAGVGKDFIGRLIHDRSGREDMPFMAANCSSMRPEKIDIELFGCLEGVQGEPERIGLLERANGGTLFLDEVGDMPYETQGKFVRVLQEHCFERLGSTNPIDLDIRVIASSSADLEAAVKAGDFRQDLFYRLNVVSLTVPSLLDRREDLADLCESFSKELCKRSDVETFKFSPSALAAMQSYNWPGNMRQLRNVIEWLTIMKSSSDSSLIQPEDLPPEIISNLPKSISIANHIDFLDLNLKEARANFERDYLAAQVARFNGNITKAAEAIGMQRSALHRKIKSLETPCDDKTDGHLSETLDSQQNIGKDNDGQSTISKKSLKKTG